MISFFRFIRKEWQKISNVEKRGVSQPPETTEYKYGITWYCGDCYDYNEIFVDKYVSCLNSEEKKIDLCCIYCGSPQTEDRTTITSAEIDDEVIEFWMRDEEAYFIPQDEDLYIRILPTEQIIRLLNRSITEGREKELSLVEALLVKFSDGTYHDSEKDLLHAWITESRSMWDQPPVWDYLRQRVIDKLSAGD